MDNLKLRPEEKAALKLRALYSSRGYEFYKMSRFEEYDFYADKKDFLTSKNVLTFTDFNGKLKALRPDVTLSIIKHIKNSWGVQKFYYDEKVYRVPRNANTFKEISQAGIECIGQLDGENVSEVLELAILSLHTIAQGRRCVLDVADAGIVSEILRERADKTEILKCLAEKNIHGLKNLHAPEKIISLAEIDEKNFSVINEKIIEKFHDEIRVDFSAVSNLNYYNGIVFRGFIEGIPESILSGGQYDNLLRVMGHKDANAIGFAVYLDLLGGLEND